MAVLGERNKIAREIHDTVGHTLTTVLIEMEAGVRLIKKNPEIAVEKINLAKSQVRKGLRDMRESVSVLNSGREILGLYSSIKLLLDETAKIGEIIINYEISDIPNLSIAQSKALYRALQEGLTNGIKHGRSTAFVFKLICDNEGVNFLLEDNGSGCERIIPGFGLSAMAQRVKESGGIFNISSERNEGCRINIRIPFREGEQNSANYNISSR
jgi:signal transduction histidine kinase